MAAGDKSGYALRLTTGLIEHRSLCCPARGRAPSTAEPAEGLARVLALGIDLQCLAEVGLGRVWLADLLMRRPARDIQVDVVGGQLDRPVEVGDGALVVALARHGQAAVVKRPGVTGVEPDRLRI